MNSSKSKINLNAKAKWINNQFIGYLVCPVTGVESSSSVGGSVSIPQVRKMVDEIGGDGMNMSMSSLIKLSMWFSTQYMLSFVDQDDALAAA